MTEKELMLAGYLYNANDTEIENDFKKAKCIIRKINNTTEEEIVIRKELYKKLFKRIGENFWIETPFQCDFGYNITIGDNFYANYDCIIIDVCDVTIGNNVFLGPRVCIYTVGHPIDRRIRDRQLEYGKKIHIGDSVWIGGNSVINPGIKIGNNVVIGSGSVVTKDIPSGVVAAGNPCKAIRIITDSECDFWSNKFNEYMENINNIGSMV